MSNVLSSTHSLSVILGLEGQLAARDQQLATTQQVGAHDVLIPPFPVPPSVSQKEPLSIKFGVIQRTSLSPAMYLSFQYHLT